MVSENQTSNKGGADASASIEQQAPEPKLQGVSPATQAASLWLDKQPYSLLVSQG